jgi:hypothetical protein
MVALEPIPSVSADHPTPLPLDLGAQGVLLGAQLRRELATGVLGPEARADLDRRLLTGHGVRAAAHPLDGPS